MKFCLNTDPQFEERCKFTEHSVWQTQYLKVVRVFFLIPKLKLSPIPPRISYKTFVPVKILAGEGKSKLPTYETVKSLVERLNEWLKITGSLILLHF